MGYSGIYTGGGVEAFTSAVERIHGYEVPNSPDTVRELSCVIPNYDGSQPSRIRFFLQQAGVVFDIHRPGPNVNDDSGLVIQINRPHSTQEFPGSHVGVDRVFDSQLGLSRHGNPRLIMARTELFSEEHERLLAKIGLGKLVVANLTPSYTFDVPYAADVAPSSIRKGIMRLPERLEALAVKLR